MRLRAQLLIVGLLMLLLPWAGCQFVIDMEQTLRQGQSLALAATGKAVAARLENDEFLLLDLGDMSPNKRILYAQTFNQAIAIDGYGDDWPNTHLVQSDTGQARLQMGYYGRYLYVLMAVNDKAINYHNPSTGMVSSGDYIALKLGDQRYIIHTSAPGNTSAYRNTTSGWQRDFSLQGVWLETEHGYRFELQLPLPQRDSTIAIAAVDQPINKAGAPITWHWFGEPNAQNVAKIAYRSNNLDTVLANFSHTNLRIRVVDLQGYTLGDAGAIQTQFEVEGQHGFITWLYKWILRSGDIPIASRRLHDIRLDEQDRQLIGQKHVANRWFYQNSSLIGRSTVALYDDEQLRGAVVIEQSTNQLLTLTNSAFNRLFLYSFVGVFSALLFLLAYASWLSLRIRRLSIAAQSALQDDGNIKTQLPSLTSADELGDLARSYHALLKQVQEYTLYLRTLSDKLSHELRTPLVIVKSSLENLASSDDTAQQAIYIERAQSGAARLSKMLMAMSAAKRIEESLIDAELEPCDVQALLQELHQAYQQAYPASTIRLNSSAIELPIAADLFVQMLDKLMDNAVDFCSEGGAIELSLQTAKDNVILCVSNDGPLLPQAMQQQLFESLVSSRDHSSGGTVHMGLGLHIVKLIAQFHGASVKAVNRADHSGVEFLVVFNR